MSTFPSIKHARRWLLERIDESLLQLISPEFRRKGDRLWRRASGLHAERVSIWPTRRGSGYVVSVSVGVRYPAFEWVRFLGDPPQGSGLGYDLGLKHHAPGDSWWPIETPQLMNRISEDIATYGVPFFRQMSTPHKVLEILLKKSPEETLFTAGGPARRTVNAASMLYSYVSVDEAIEHARSVLVSREVLGFQLDDRGYSDLEEFVRFIQGAPVIPRLRLP